MGLNARGCLLKCRVSSKKELSPLWTKVVQAPLSVEKLRYSTFNHRGAPVKAVKCDFNLRKHQGISFLTCGRPLKVVQACLSRGKLRCSRFNHRGCPVKAV